MVEAVVVTWQGTLAHPWRWGTNKGWAHPFGEALLLPFLVYFFYLWIQVMVDKALHVCADTWLTSLHAHHLGQCGTKDSLVQSAPVTLSAHFSWPYNHRRLVFRGSAKFAKVIVEACHWQRNWSTTHWGMGAMWVSGLVEGQPPWPLWTVISSPQEPYL